MPSVVMSSVSKFTDTVKALKAECKEKKAKKLDHEELLDKQLEDTVSHLKSDILKKVSSAMSSASKFTDTVIAELEKKKNELHALTITKDKEMSSLYSTIEVSRT